MLLNIHKTFLKVKSHENYCKYVRDVTDFKLYKYDLQVYFYLYFDIHF